MATVVTAPVRTVASQTRSPLALWHLLSLDAPTVAVLWTVFLARAFGVTLHWTTPAALGVAVWMFYAADRLSDAAHGGPTQERHRFHHRHRRIFFAALLCVVPVLVLLVVALPSAIRTAWLMLAIPLACYVFAVHVLKLATVPKEPLVACFFACATALPAALLEDANLFPIVCAGASFGLLCWLNCAAIARWEFTPSTDTDSATAWLSARLVTAAAGAAAAFLLAAAFLMASTFLMAATWFRIGSGALSLADTRGCAVFFAAVGCSAAALALLDLSRSRTDPITRRALADAVLLAPIALWPLLSHVRPR